MVTKRVFDQKCSEAKLIETPDTHSERAYFYTGFNDCKQDVIYELILSMTFVYLLYSIIDTI